VIGVLPGVGGIVGEKAMSGLVIVGQPVAVVVGRSDDLEARQLTHTAGRQEVGVGDHHLVVAGVSTLQPGEREEVNPVRRLMPG